MLNIKSKNFLKSISFLLFAAMMIIPMQVNAQSRKHGNSQARTTTTTGKPKRLKVAKAEYQCCLKPQAGTTYYASNLVDGNPNTAWAVNLSGDIYDCDALYGPCFTFSVKCKKLAYIVVRNGYGKNDSAYKNNARATTIRIEAIPEHFDEESDEFFTTIVDGKLKDVPTPQTIYALDNKYNKNFRGVQLVFDTPDNGGIYSGSKWNNLFLSEIEFWGYE